MDELLDVFCAKTISVALKHFIITPPPVDHILSDEEIGQLSIISNKLSEHGIKLEIYQLPTIKQIEEMIYRSNLRSELLNKVSLIH